MSEGQQGDGGGGGGRGRGGFFGGPGFRQYWRGDIEREVKIPLLAAWIVTIRGFVIVGVAYALVLIIGPAIVPFACAILALVTARMLHWATSMRDDLAFAQTVIFVLVAFVLGAVSADDLWEQTLGGAAAAAGRAVMLTLEPILAAGPFLWLAAGVLWVIVAALVDWQVATGLLLFLAAAFLWLGMDRREAILLARLWQRARWLLVPPLVVVAAASAVLILAMIKELSTPAVEPSVEPMTWQEFQEAGGFWRLWLPRRKRHAGVTDPPVPGPPRPYEIPVTVVRHDPDTGEREEQPFRLRPLEKPTRSGIRGFWRDLIQDPPEAAFSEKGSEKERGAVSFQGKREGSYGFSQREWAFHRGEFERCRLSSTHRRTQPAVLNDSGYRFIIAHVVRWYGMGAVPEKWADVLSYLPPNQGGANPSVDTQETGSTNERTNERSE